MLQTLRTERNFEEIRWWKIFPQRVIFRCLIDYNYSTEPVKKRFFFFFRSSCFSLQIPIFLRLWKEKSSLFFIYRASECMKDIPKKRRITKWKSHLDRQIRLWKSYRKYKKFRNKVRLTRFSLYESRAFFWVSEMQIKFATTMLYFSKSISL